MIVSIRRYRDRDVNAHCDAVIESKEQLQRWFSWCHSGYTTEDSRCFIEKTSREEWDKDIAYSYAIVDKKVLFGNDYFLGNCCLRIIPGNKQISEANYWVRTNKTGKKVATRAVKQLIERGFKKHNLSEIHINVARCNNGSIQVAKNMLKKFDGYGPIHTNPVKCYLIGCDCPAVKFIILPKTRGRTSP